MKRTVYLNRLFCCTFVSALLVSALPVEGEAQAPASQEEQPLVVNFEDADWGEPGFAEGFPQGVQSARLGIGPENGGPTYFAKFPAGSHFDLHWHTHAEYVVVVSGEVTIVLGEQSHSLLPGSYIVIPARMNHSWDVPGEDDSVILVRRRGPADFNFVGR
jgi:quercetin dioxygenase-like cupin family protein